MCKPRSSSIFIQPIPFSGRLMTDAEKNDFFKIIQSTCKSALKADLAKAMSKHVPIGVPLSGDSMRNLIFGNYMEPDADPRVYDEVDNMPKVERIMNYYLNEYNAKAGVPLNLILFRSAIEHISR